MIMEFDKLIAHEMLIRLANPNRSCFIRDWTDTIVGLQLTMSEDNARVIAFLLKDSPVIADDTAIVVIVTPAQLEKIVQFAQANGF